MPTPKRVCVPPATSSDVLVGDEEAFLDEDDLDGLSDDDDEDDEEGS